MILSALNNYYNRLIERKEEGIPLFGYSQEKISYAVILSVNGDVLDVQDIRDTSGKKPQPKLLNVPRQPKRSSNIKPCFLWDKSSYVFGVPDKTDEKVEKRAREAHQQFKKRHFDLLKECKSPHLKAFVDFLKKWKPNTFWENPLFSDSMLGANFVFRIDGEFEYIHECKEAQEISRRIIESDNENKSLCLVTGEVSSIERIHSSVKGVYGAQSSGASIVSFNKDAFTSYGKSQGNNAPVSKKAAFAYTTALNYLLRKDSNQKIQLGDATTVYWAESQSREQAEAAENLFNSLLGKPADDASETEKLKAVLESVAKGRPLKDLNTDLEDNTKIFLLGLAPNASRLSVRFWETDSLRGFSERIAQHYRDMEMQPLPWKTEPSVWRLVMELAPHRDGAKEKMSDVPPQIAGELIRSILTGVRYPQSLLSHLVMRMRADGRVSPLRVAMCKAVMVRNARITNKSSEKEIPMSLDIDNTDQGYLLGRLFATLEDIQKSALGKEINATIRDRYYGSASATPASVFPVLLRNTQHHLSRLRKDKPGIAVNMEKKINEIIDKLPPNFPKSLGISAQGRFAIGYYHQSKYRFSDKESNS